MQEENIRLKRVATQYFEELSKMLIGEVSEPKLADARITKVSFTKDLRLAKIFFVVTNKSTTSQKNALLGFKKSRGFLKRELGKRIPLRYVPDLQFIFDETEEISRRVDELFYLLEQDSKKKQSL